MSYRRLKGLFAYSDRPIQNPSYAPGNSLRVRGKTIRSVLCNIVCNNCAQCDAHTYEPTNSSLDWVLFHWAHLTVLRFIFVLCITVCCMHAYR